MSGAGTFDTMTDLSQVRKRLRNALNTVNPFTRVHPDMKVLITAVSHCGCLQQTAKKLVLSQEP